MKVYQKGKLIEKVEYCCRCTELGFLNNFIQIGRNVNGEVRVMAYGIIFQFCPSCGERNEIKELV
jgi:ribosomal protein S27AE